MLSTDRLTELLWPGKRPQRPAKNVQVLVARLRKLLAPDGDLLETVGTSGYRLKLRDEQLDGARFEALVRDGRAALAADLPDRAARLLDAAAELWRDAPLADLPYADFAQGESARLRELRRAAVETRLEVALALGHGASLVPELEALVATHPERERVPALLAHALYRAGRQADALAALRDARERLDASAGLRPPPILARLEQQILRQDPALDPPRVPPTTLHGIPVAPATARIALCGPLRISAPSAELPAVPDGSPRVVLAALLLASDGLGHEQLADAVWGSGPPRDPRAALRTILSRLRPTLAAFGARLERDGQRTRLQLPAGWEIDVIRARADARDATAALLAGQAPTAAELARRAHAVLERPFLPGAAGPWAERVRGELRALDAAVLDTLEGALPASGAPEAVLVAEAIVARSPVPRALASMTAQLGREVELEALARAAARARSGERTVALVSGEPGIGKTRLAGELATALAADGWRVLYGRADEGGVVPYQPVTEALRTAVRAGWPAERDGLAELADLIPELGTPPAPQRDAETARYRLFEAFDRAFAQLAEAGPVLLVLDDLHWADQPTLLAVRHLARTREDGRLLIVATYRDTELALPLLAQLREDLRRDGRLTLCALTGLERGDVGALAPAWLPGGAVDRLWAATGGNPLLVEQLAQGLAEDGVNPDDPLLGVRIPELVRELMERRLARLPEATATLLLDAAVAGTELRFEVLAGLAGDADAALVALGHATEARLLVPGAHGRHAFKHAVLRRTLYELALPARRAHVHLRVARLLEAATPPASAAELAHHFFQARHAGGALSALHYAVEAARRESRAYAHEAAVRHLQRALKLQRRLRPEMTRERAELMLELGAALDRAGDVGWSRWWYRRAAATAHAEGHAELLTAAATGFAAWQRYAIVDGEAVKWLELALPGSTGAPRARVLGLLAARRDPWAPGREQQWREALALARAAGDPGTLAAVVRYAPYALWRPGALDERLAAAHEAIRLGDPEWDRAASVDAPGAEPPAIRLRSTEWALSGHIDACVDELEAGRLELALGHLESVRALAGETRLAWADWHVPLLESTLASLTGRLGDAARLSDAAHALRRRRDPDTDEAAVAQAVALAKLDGSLAEADVSALARLAGRFPRRPVWAALLVLADVEAGREERARAAFERLAADTDQPLATIALLGEAAARLGDAERAGELHARLVPYRARTVVVERGWASWGPLSRVLGLAACAAGDLERGRAYLREGASLHMGAPWGVHLALDYIEHGSPSAGERETLLAGAHDTAAAFGLERLRERCGKLAAG